MNLASSRSHCIFTISLEGKMKDDENYFVSKLHLVDLAGSERAGRSQIQGSVLSEAKYINLSLTYLEQVRYLRGLADGVIGYHCTPGEEQEASLAYSIPQFPYDNHPPRQPGRELQDRDDR